MIWRKFWNVNNPKCGLYRLSVGHMTAACIKLIPCMEKFLLCNFIDIGFRFGPFGTHILILSVVS